MQYSHYRVPMVQDFTPSWAKYIAYTKEWKDALECALPLEHIALQEIRGAQDFKESQKSLGLQRESYGESYDALYLSSSGDLHELVPLFNELSPGATVLLEPSSRKWKLKEMKRFSESVGGDLIFFSSVNTHAPHSKSPNKVVVLQKKVFFSKKKMISIILPIHSSLESNPRVLQWLQFFETMELLPFVELLLVFDGIHDALPAWKECEGLEREQGFQMLRHYRSFGKLECIRSAFYFARGKYLLWDGDEHSPSSPSCIPCAELFSIFDLVPESAVKSSLKNPSTEPLGIFTKAWLCDLRSAKKVGKAFFPSFFLLNSSASKLFLLQKRDYKKNEHEEFCKSRDKELPEKVQKALKKAKAKIMYASLTAYPSR